MRLKTLLSRTATLLAVLGMFGATAAWSGDSHYDRLDGTGASGKRVDVIEWEGNLEIHVYPKGSVAGLGMKIDHKSGQKVMVIAYRFVENPTKILTRRNILGIPLSDSFKVYKDPMENEFDKFIISDNGLSGQVVAYKLDPTPTQLYPEGTALANSGQNQNKGRMPASVEGSQPGTGYSDPSQNVPPSQGVDDSGSLPSFFSTRDQGGGGRR